MPFPADTATYLLQLVALGIVSVIGFLTKRAFNDLVESMQALSTKIDTVQATIASQDKGIALLEQRIERLESDLREMRLEGMS